MKGHKAVKILLPAAGSHHRRHQLRHGNVGHLRPAVRPRKEEDRLVVYTSHKEEVYWPIYKEFEERTVFGWKSSPAAPTSF